MSLELVKVLTCRSCLAASAEHRELNVTNPPGCTHRKVELVHGNFYLYQNIGLPGTLVRSEFDIFRAPGNQRLMKDKDEGEG